MESPVGAVLSKAGVRVTEQQFARLVAEALADLGPPPADDPAAALTGDDVAALTAVGADLAPRRRREADPRASGAAAVATLLAETRTVSDVAAALGVDASRVRHRLARHQLVGIRRTDGWRLPDWQFGADGRPLPGLERVLRALPPAVHPLVLARMFLTPQPDLVLHGRAVTPRAWLARGGDPAPVVAIAAALDLLG